MQREAIDEVLGLHRELHNAAQNFSSTQQTLRSLSRVWYPGACPDCRVPDWKLAKYSSTQFRRHHGSDLREGGPSK